MRKLLLLIVISLFLPTICCKAQVIYSENYRAEFMMYFGMVGYNVSWGFDKQYEEARIMVNDYYVNAKSDFDFNDLVFDARLTNHGASITVRAVGTTYPIRVGGKEAHGLFGVSTSTIINTQELKYDAVTFDIDGDFGGDFNKIEVEMQDENGNWLPLQSRRGDASAKLAVPTTVKWCMEKECISDVYPDFIRYVSGENINWYEDYHGTSTEPTPDDDNVKIGIFEFKLNHDDNTAEVTSFDCKSYSIDIPESIEFNGKSYTVVSIGDYASKDGKSNPEGNFVTIPKSVKTIGSYAFYDMFIYNAHIPESVTLIKSHAFCSFIYDLYLDSFSSWCNITFEDEISNPLWDANNLHVNGEIIHDIVIPEGVTSIPNYAFMGKAFNTISIPSSISSISKLAFGVCNNLTDLYCHSANVPSTDIEAFDVENIKNVVLHVPANSIDAYKSTSPWNQFKEIIALSGSGDDNPSVIDSPIVGKWKFLWSTPYASFRMTHVEFKADGTFSYTSADKSDYEEHGVYKIEEDVLYQMFSDENDWELSRIKSADSNYLTLIDLSDDGLEELRELYFLNENNSGSNEPLTGTWLGSYSYGTTNYYEQWIFNSDGTGSSTEWHDGSSRISTEPFTYTVSGSSIVIDWGDGSPETYEYSISGVTLTLSRYEQSKKYYKQGIETRIHSIKLDKGDNEIYSLRGEKLKSPRKGINIIGGKKVLAK